MSAATAHDVDVFPWIICPDSLATDKLEPANTMHKNTWCSLCGTHLGTTEEVWPA